MKIYTKESLEEYVDVAIAELCEREASNEILAGCFEDLLGWDRTEINWAHPDDLADDVHEAMQNATGCAARNRNAMFKILAAAGRVLDFDDGELVTFWQIASVQHEFAMTYNA